MSSSCLFVMIVFWTKRRRHDNMKSYSGVGVELGLFLISWKKVAQYRSTELISINVPDVLMIFFFFLLVTALWPQDRALGRKIVLLDNMQSTTPLGKRDYAPCSPGNRKLGNVC